MRDTVKGIPEDDDGYEWSLRSAKRSCLALVGLLAFFWVAAGALQLAPGTPHEEPLVVAILVAIALSVVTAASFVRERIARVGIGAHLARIRELRRPRAVYATFATATVTGVMVAQAPALCGFMATAMTRSFIPLALGTAVTAAAWALLWPRRMLWDRWTWQARLRRDDEAQPASAADPSAG
jgi:hypothetical protein